jgi:hypothetical protein
MVGLFFLFACSPIYWETSVPVTIAWDAPTHYADGSPIPPDKELRYYVYIDTDTDDTHNDKKRLTPKPIAETSYRLPVIEEKGKYFIGIQAVVCGEKDKGGCEESEVSPISWSSNQSITKKGPFGIQVK